MRKSRWEHLDHHPPTPAGRRAPEPAPAEGTPPPVPPGAPEAELPEPLRAAAALLRLRCYPEAAAAAGAALRADPDLAGGHRLVGLALGLAGETAAARAALREAVRLEPADAGLRAMALSAELAAGGQDAEPAAEPTGPLAELAGAARWDRGRRRALAGDGRPAGLEFAAAAELFALHSPAEAVAERLGACYRAATLAALLADQAAAAQQAFGHYRRLGPLPPEAEEFARRLYPLAEGLADLTPAERAEALAPLRQHLQEMRLVVRFYPGAGPVCITWLADGVG
jgi:hypothetical protein